MPNSPAEGRGAGGNTGSEGPPEGQKTHLEKAREYTEGVISGRIPAGKYVRLACQRQVSDLKRYADHPVLFFDEEAAERVCRFIERLPHIKGPKANAGELIDLEPWQCFALTTIFGWLRKDTGGRRFRKAYTEVPRGNGKSSKSSGIALYCLRADGEQGADVYSAATTRDQARIVFGDSRSMLNKRPDLRDKLGLDVLTHSIVDLASSSKYVPLSREANSLEGLNIHCAVVDELHAHKTREVYDVLESGLGKRQSSLIYVITTAGTDTAGICYEVRGYVIQILEGKVDDNSQFGIIYGIDDGDRWDDPKVWRKANPNWGISVDPILFEANAKKAAAKPAALANFKTKHLNIWGGANDPWMDMAAWDRCADPTLKIEDFKGSTCFVGLDLAAKVDIAAKGKLFKRRDPKKGGKPGELEEHYFFFLDSYLPEAAIEAGRNSQYGGWTEEGWIQSTPGEVLDFGVIRDEIIADRSALGIDSVAYDPWQALQISQELTAAGLKMVEVRATVQNFSEPMKMLEALVKSGRFHHDGNPVMRWMMANVVAHYDAKENIYPRKERPENKIDGVVAAIMALSRALLYGIQDSNPYSSRGLLFLG